MSKSIKDILKESQQSLLTPFIPVTDDNDLPDDVSPSKQSIHTPDRIHTPDNIHTPDGPPPSIHSSDDDPSPIWMPDADVPHPKWTPRITDKVPAEIFSEKNDKKSSDNHYTSLSSNKKFDLLVNYFYKANPFTYSSEKNYELEVRFGTQKQNFSKIDFDNVIGKLKSFGFTTSNTSGEYSLRMNNEFLHAETGKFRLSDIRVEINGLYNIHQYCKTNDLKDIYKTQFSSVNFQKKRQMKSPKGEILFPANFYDFNFRVAYNEEQKISDGLKNFIINNWDKTKKNYRLLNRVTFTHDDFPCKVDLSTTKYADKVTRKIREKEQQVMVTTYKVVESNVFKNNEVYEIEIEIDNSKIGPGTKYDSPELILTSLKKVIKFILSGLQGTNFPISVKEQHEVISSYKELIWKNDKSVPKFIDSRSFIGPNSKTLQLTNIAKIESPSATNNQNIRKDYVVTEKADGLRHLMFVTEKGKVYLIDTNMNIIFTGAKTKNAECFNTIIDGELIKCNKMGEFINLFAAFDVYYYNGKDVRANSFMLLEKEKDMYKSRYQILKHIVSSIELLSILTVNSNTVELDNKKILSPIQLSCKQFYPYSKKDSIFKGCNEILTKIEENRFDYETDGLIFTHAYYGVGSDKIGVAGPKKRRRWDYSFKWKPSEFNTIDFLVTTLKKPDGSEIVKPIFEHGMNTESVDQLSTYKTIELRCGFNPKVDGYINPCQDIIDDKITEHSEDTKNEYIPIRFYPTEPYDINAGLCKIMLKMDDSGTNQMFTSENDVFTDNTIVEFSYDMSREEGWRWIPLRVRYDKTHELRKGGTNFGNNYETANNNWKSIHNPITETMIRSGNNIPSIEVAEDKYYNSSIKNYYTKALKHFHNLFVKRILINGVARKSDKLIDLTCGKAGDLPKWIEAKLSFVFGLDRSKDNLENRLDGACSRYLNSKKEFKEVPGALFVNANSELNIKNGNALLNDKAKQITNAIFGIGKKDEHALGKGVYKHFGVGIGGFDIASCQFSIHYFFKSPETLMGFLQNIAECTKLNGYFIGTTYDGNTIFKMLSKIKTNESIQIIENGTKIWEINKSYGSDIFNPDSSCIGYKIDVFQESIGQVIPEYLVNFEYFEYIMELYGFKIIPTEEAKEMGLANGSGMFEELYNLMMEKISQNKFIKTNFGDATNMTKTEKKISFLNRYFIFKKIREVNLETIQLELTPFSDAQIEMNKAATTKSKKIIKNQTGLTKSKQQIVLEQATDSAGIKPTKPKRGRPKKIIIEQE